MTPEEFFDLMTGPGCVVQATLNHCDHPDRPLRFEFPNYEVFVIFMANAPLFAKIVGHDGKVTITLSCSCGEAEPIVVPL
jgi:hypothetical protein